MDRREQRRARGNGESEKPKGVSVSNGIAEVRCLTRRRRASAHEVAGSESDGLINDPDTQDPEIETASRQPGKPRRTAQIRGGLPRHAPAEGFGEGVILVDGDGNGSWLFARLHCRAPVRGNCGVRQRRPASAREIMGQADLGPVAQIAVKLSLVFSIRRS
jgi:hypothetical protein